MGSALRWVLDTFVDVAANIRPPRRSGVSPGGSAWASRYLRAGAVVSGVARTEPPCVRHAVGSGGPSARGSGSDPGVAAGGCDPLAPGGGLRRRAHRADHHPRPAHGSAASGPGAHPCEGRRRGLGASGPSRRADESGERHPPALDPGERAAGAPRPPLARCGPRCREVGMGFWVLYPRAWHLSEAPEPPRRSPTDHYLVAPPEIARQVSVVLAGWPAALGDGSAGVVQVR